MELVNVLVAAAGSWIFGAVYYMTLSKPWIEAAGIELDENGRPKSRPGVPAYLPFVLSAIAMIIVAGMMRHMLSMAGIESPAKSLLVGLGVGAFFIFPWTMINNAYAGRPFKLTTIDGGYAVGGSGIIGLILGLF